MTEDGAARVAVVESGGNGAADRERVADIVSVAETVRVLGLGRARVYQLGRPRARGVDTQPVQITLVSLQRRSCPARAERVDQVRTLRLESRHPIELIDITEAIAELVCQANLWNGEVHLPSRHTTAAVRIQENEPLLLEDLCDFLARLAAPTLEVHFKLFGTDGVSLQSQELSKALRNNNWQVHACASDVPEGILGLRVPELSYQSDDAVSLRHRLFQPDRSARDRSSASELIAELTSGAQNMRAQVERYVDEHRIRVLHVRNIMSLPYNMSATLAFYRAYSGAQGPFLRPAAP